MLLPEAFPGIILASRSPRRRTLFSETGFDVSICDLDADESFPAHLKDAEVAEYLAWKKAHSFHGDYSGRVLVCADTIVVHEHKVLNKPVDETEAFSMLSRLSGSEHRVFTGVCMKYGERERVFHEVTEVHFRSMSEQEIRFYISNFKPFDKAGSYGIQDWLGYTCVTRVNGCFYNVMGFPMSRFYRELKEFLSDAQ
ncbi:MAG: septum formation protein Maf [Bacteroidetes bacterium]|nr:septum formation protein Maf [Bacteroidota bacterium]